MFHIKNIPVLHKIRNNWLDLSHFTACTRQKDS